jgi:hypothetical protein
LNERHIFTIVITNNLMEPGLTHSVWYKTVISKVVAKAGFTFRRIK